MVLKDDCWEVSHTFYGLFSTSVLALNEML
jgi:hypothetical protein